MNESHPDDAPLIKARQWADDNAALAIRRHNECMRAIELSPPARKAFARRQEILIAAEAWLIAHWYTDEDFCRAYNTAVAMADRATAAEALVAEWERMFPSHTLIVRDAAQKQEAKQQ